MKKDARKITLSNGLTVHFCDNARRYFGDYHRVKLEVHCEVPVTPELFDDDAMYRDALSKLGKTVTYRRCEEQMGIPTAQVDECVEKLIERFSSTALRYFDTADFPRRLAQSELAKAKRPRRQLMPMLSNG